MSEIELKIKEVSEMFCADSPECRMKRFELLLPHILEAYKGNLIEIGCGFGLTTSILCKADPDRYVFAIDPFNVDYDMGEFMEVDFNFLNLHHIKLSSQNSEVSRILAHDTPFSFAFIDGGQLKHEVLHDLEMCQMLGVKVICIDDMNRETPTSQVPEAVKEFQKTSEYKLIKTHPLIEGYLIRK